MWLYKRSASTPAKPTTTSTYTFSLGTIEGQDNGWTQAVPEFNYYPLWAIQAVATATAPIDTNTIANTQWGSQIKIAENGADGVNGSNGLDGYNQATILLYQRATSTPVVTDIADPITYTFSNGAITGTIGSWVRDIASTTGENPLYVISCVAISSLTTDSIARSEWSTPVVMAENGTNGTEGVDSTSYWLICDTGAVSKDL